MTANTRARQRRRASRVARLRASRDGLGRAHKPVVPPRPLLRGIPQHHIKLGGTLRVAADPASAFAQLEELDLLARRLDAPCRVHVDMADVECFDAAALLFLSSRLELLAKHPAVARLGGTYPRHPEAVEAMRSAGFGEFISSQSRQIRQQADRAVKLIKGATQADPAIVGAEIQAFLAEHCPSLGIVESDHVYIALQEALENITLHAYPNAPLAIRWYAVGLFDPQTARASVAILDVGVGILETVRTRATLPSLVLSPFQFLVEATSGASTSSGDRKRGKGLSTLRKFALDSPGRVLHVLSSGGCIRWSNDGDRPATASVPAFPGTIVLLEIDGVGAYANAND